HVAAGLVLVGLVALGWWQLERQAWKSELLADLARRAASAPLTVVDDPAGLHDFTRVRVSGRWLADRSFVLHPRTLNGRSGGHLVTPLALEGGGVVLVLRGWVERDWFAGGIPAQ